MKLFLIARSNMRKNRTAMITLMILLMVATAMLYIGNSVMLRINSFIDEKNEITNGASFITISSQGDEEEVEKILYSIGGVVDIEAQNVINYNMVSIRNVTKDFKAKSLMMLVSNMDDVCKYSTLSLEEYDKNQQLTKNSMILPYYLKVADGYEIGDEIEFEIQGKTYSYVIYGFHEDAIFSNPTNSGQMKCFVNSEEYEYLSSVSSPDTKKTLNKVKLDKGLDSAKFEEKFIKESTDSGKFKDGSLLQLNYDTMKQAAGITMNLFMIMLIIFAMIIVIVTIVIIRFTIITFIEENIKNLGSMQAMGYTSSELIKSLLAQFLGLALIAYLFGILLSYLGGGIVNNLVSVSTGLAWTNNIDVISAFISLLIVTVIVTLITLQTAHRIKKLNPITALRNGILTHNFKKNHLPFQKSPFSLNLSVGLKSFFQNRKQNIAIGVISTLITFALAFTFILYQNFIKQHDVMNTMVGIEQVIQVAYSGEDRGEVFKQIASMDEIEKSVLHDKIDMTVTFQENQNSTCANICEDYSKLSLDTIVNGRYAIHENEIVLSNVVSRTLGAKIGDVVSIKYGENTSEYIVVGLNQHIYQLGNSISITNAGMEQLNKDYKGSTLYLYPKDVNAAADIIKKIETTFEGKDIICQDMVKMEREMTDSVNQAIMLFIIIFLVVIIGVISITMHYLVKVKLIKEKTSIGINKALGFTTKQILCHITVSFCPIVIAGSLLGGIVARVFMNSIFCMMFYFTGISQASLVLPMSIIILSIVGIVTLTVVTTVISSLKIRKIDPCELFR